MMKERRAASRRMDQRRDLIGSRSFRTCPPPRTTIDTLPPHDFYPEGSAGRALIANLPFATPELSNPEHFSPLEYAQKKIAAKERPFHIYTKSAHEEIAPCHRPIVPMPCRHVPQGLCDDCPTCQWYMAMDLPFWAQVEDMMTEQEIRENEPRWNNPLIVKSFAGRLHHYDTLW